MRHIRVETATHSTRPQLNSRTHSVLDPPDFLSNFKCLYGSLARSVPKPLMGEAGGHQPVGTSLFQ